MASGGRQIFEEVSDEDSISLASTASSEVVEEYNVERILDEQMDLDTGVPSFLVKWENYPLHESTWEPAENFSSDIMLNHWRRRKVLIEQGREKPFDLQNFYELEERARNQQEERKERRAAKKLRLGLVNRSTRDGGRRMSTADIGAEDLEESSADEPLAGRKRQKMSPVRRKGIAQPIKKLVSRKSVPVTVQEVSGSETGEYHSDHPDSDSGDSLMEELQAKSGDHVKSAQGNASDKPRPTQSTASHKTGTATDLPSKKRTLSDLSLIHI